MSCGLVDSLPQTTSNMPDPDNQMDGTGVGSWPCPPHCFPCNCNCSASPRAHDKHSQRQGVSVWGYKPHNQLHCGTVVHNAPHAMTMSMHVNNTSVDNDQSYSRRAGSPTARCSFPTASGWRNTWPLVGPTTSSIWAENQWRKRPGGDLLSTIAYHGTRGWTVLIEGKLVCLHCQEGGK